MRLLLSLTLMLTLFLAPAAKTQEQGEMLIFDGRPDLDARINRATLQAGSGNTIYTSPASRAASQPVDRILFNGIFSGENIEIEISYVKPDGLWSTWQAVYTKRFSNGRFWARFDAPVQTSQVKYRLLDQGFGDEVHVEIFAVEGVDLKEAELDARAEQRKEPPALFGVTDPIPRPDVVSRAEWSANPPIGAYIPHQPFRFAQHHTAGKRVATLADGIAEQQFIQDFHQNGRGWQDIGYHFTIDDSGRIYEGVPPQFRGTHVGGNNTGNIGISYFGNYQLSAEFPTQAALDALPKIWSYLAFEYGVNPDSLFGHRDYTATSCPGDNFYSRLTELRNNIRKELGLGRPYAVNPLPQPFTEEVDPGTPVQVTVRDEHGIDESSLSLRINGELVAADISGSGDTFTLFYRPAEPFPNSQTVVVTVAAADLDTPPDSMTYAYRFSIEVEALHAEVNNASDMRNAGLELQGDWQLDASDVGLSDLTNGARLLASDTDGSHIARVSPAVPQPGDYSVFMASNTNFLGESARYRFVNAAGAVHPHFTEYNTVFFRKWGRLSPTPVHFDTTDGQTGLIELSGLTDLQTKLVLDALRLEKVDRLDSPATPTMKWVRRLSGSGGQHEIEAAWYPTLEGDVIGYRLFLSEDGRVWGSPFQDESTLTQATTSHRFTYSGASSTLYFRVVAVDSNNIEVEGGAIEPLLSGPSDIYGAGLNRTSSILVVDNFDRQASWNSPHHPFVRSHGEAIAASGHGFDSCTETAVQNGEISLSDYDVVFYLCGDDSRSDESLAAADQFRLLTYLENGGKLFISGSEIGFDFASTTSAELSRYQNLLKARYLGDLSGSNQVLGVDGGPFAGLDFIYGTVSSDETYFEDFPDFIQPNGGSSSALIYANLRIAAVEFTGTYGTSTETAQLIYLGFPFETIVEQEDRALLMEKALQYFGLATSVAGTPTPNLPQRFELGQNYPNPFNPTTTIRYSVPASQGAQKVKLEIFNALGQRIRTLVNQERAPGDYNVQWDGKTEDRTLAASGVYIYRLTAGNFIDSKKMLFLK